LCIGFIGDNGETWDLIAGIAGQGTANQTAAWDYQKSSSFRGRLGATNCEDPSSDVVFSIGGSISTLTNPMQTVNDVWSSTEGLWWFKYWTQDLTSRYYASCDIDTSGHVYTSQFTSQSAFAHHLLYWSIISQLIDWLFD
jgi:hypothetical protein